MKQRRSVSFVPGIGDGRVDALEVRSLADGDGVAVGTLPEVGGAAFGGLLGDDGTQPIQGTTVDLTLSGATGTADVVTLPRDPEGGSIDYSALEITVGGEPTRTTVASAYD